MPKMNSDSPDAVKPVADPKPIIRDKTNYPNKVVVSESVLNSRLGNHHLTQQSSSVSKTNTSSPSTVISSPSNRTRTNSISCTATTLASLPSDVSEETCHSTPLKKQENKEETEVIPSQQKRYLETSMFGF